MLAAVRNVISRQEIDQLYSKLDKELVADSGSQRSVISSTESFHEKMERQRKLATPPPSLISVQAFIDIGGVGGKDKEVITVKRAQCLLEQAVRKNIRFLLKLLRD